MTKKHTIIYTLLAASCATAYPFIRSLLIQQEPSGLVAVSTLTLNYVLLFALAGGVGTYLGPRVFKKMKKSYAGLIGMVVLVALLMVIMTFAGAPMQWTE